METKKKEKFTDIVLYIAMVFLVIGGVFDLHSGDIVDGLLHFIWVGNTLLFILTINRAKKVIKKQISRMNELQDKMSNTYSECNGRILNKTLSIERETSNSPWSKAELNAYREGMRVAYGQSRDILIDVLGEIDKEPDVVDYLSKPGAIFKIYEEPSAMYMSLGVKDGQVVCCNGVNIKTGEVIKQMDGNATIPTNEEIDAYWENFKRLLK